MNDYKRPVPKPYDNGEVQVALSNRPTDLAPRLSKDDSFDDGYEIASKSWRTESSQSHKKSSWASRFLTGSHNSPRRPTFERRIPSRTSRNSTKDRARRSKSGATEDHVNDEDADGGARAHRPVASDDDESEAELSDSINPSSSAHDDLLALTPSESYPSSYVKYLQHQIQEKSRQVNRLVRDLSHIQRADNYARDDWHFIDMVQKLRELIKNWSRMQRFQRHHLNSATRELSIVGPSYGFFLANPPDIARLIQAYVWIRLQDHVFNLHPWAGDMCDQFQNLEDMLRPTLLVSNAQHAQFHEWRAITARLINQKLTDENPPENKSVSESLIRQILGPLAPDDMADDSKFSYILKKAMELASEIAKQKAELTFSRFHDSIKFNPDMMDDIKEDESRDWSRVLRKVRMVTAPALVRSGDSSGEDYHVKTPVVKAEVICSISFERHQTTPF